MSISRCISIVLAMPTLVLWVAPVAASGLTVRIVPAVTDRYILTNDAPAVATAAAAIQLALTPGEYEPASFVVYADSQLNDLQVTAAPLIAVDGAALAGAVVDVHVVKRWYQRNFGDASDPADARNRYIVPELLLHDDELVVVRDGQNMLRMTSGEYVNVSEPDIQGGFWTPAPNRYPVSDSQSLQPLTIAAQDNRQFWVTVHVPQGAAAGIYASAITLQVGDLLERIPVSVEVLPFKLAEPMINYSMYYRGVLSDKWPEGSVSSEYKSSAQMLADLQNLRRHGIASPSVYQLIGSGQLGEVLQLRSAAGITAPQLYYLGVNVVANDDGAVSPRLTNDVQKTLAVTKPAGIKDVYFYARDEARGDEIKYQFPFWQAVRDAGGKIMAAGWQTGMQKQGNFDVTGGAEDLYVALGSLRRQEAARWHGKQRLIYSYQNPTGGRELPETWRRNYGLLLWQFDFDGGMPYAWQHSYGNAWNDFDHRRHKDHNFTYPTVNEPIDTVQWEGLREGVDDVRYLTTLTTLLATAKNSAVTAEAQRWVAGLKELSLGQADLTQIRAQMTGYILALQPAAAELAAPSSTTLAVGEIDAAGNVAVTLRADVRQPARLEILDGSNRRVIESHALLYEHTLQVNGVEADKTYQLQAVATDTDGQRRVIASAELSAAKQLQLAGVRTNAGGQVNVSVDLGSNYRASLAVDTNRSLLGWWRFTEGKDNSDISSWQQAAALKGDARRGAGKFGAGVELDGDGSFISMPNIDFAENGVGTIEGWYRFNSFAMDNLVNMGLLSGLYQHGSNNHFYFLRTNDFFEVGSLLRTDTWHHIALTWDGDASSAIVYIDGHAVRASVQGKIDDIKSIDGLNIGRSTGYFGGMVGAATNTFAGAIDELKVWNRALSAAEVVASYRGGAGSFVYSAAQVSPADSIVLRAINAAAEEAASELKP